MARLRERPVLLYHQIGDYPPARPDFAVGAAAFAAHLKYLSEMGLEVLALDRMLAQMKGEAPWNPAAVSLTFDGGFRDAAETVLPLLAEGGMPAAFFIPADFVGKKHGLYGGPLPCMDWPQLRELAAAGMTIASLGRRGEMLRQLPGDAWQEDARAARQTLEDALGAPVRWHAYRQGFPDRRQRAWFVEQGFEAVFTQCPTFRRPDPYRIGRVQVDDEDVNILRTKASNLYLFFKDTRTWRFIRRYRVDRLMHRVYAFFERSG
ncbi:MAG: polysaccharide deacetylase family protein [Nitrospinota bacterium]